MAMNKLLPIIFLLIFVAGAMGDTWNITSFTWEFNDDFNNTNWNSPSPTANGTTWVLTGTGNPTESGTIINVIDDSPTVNEFITAADPIGTNDINFTLYTNFSVNADCTGNEQIGIWAGTDGNPRSEFNSNSSHIGACIKGRGTCNYTALALGTSYHELLCTFNTVSNLWSCYLDNNASSFGSVTSATVASTGAVAINSGIGANLDTCTVHTDWLRLSTELWDGSMITAGGSNESLSVVLNTPANDTHDNILTVDFNYTPTWIGVVDPLVDQCTLFINGTQENKTETPNNNTVNTLSYTLPSDGLYNWGISCNLTNGTTFASAENRTYYYDTISPIVTINSPTVDQEFYYSSVSNLDVYANDTNLFNLTCDVYFDNGTLVTSYVNDTGTPPFFNLTDEFTSTLSCPTCGSLNYSLNCSAQDSHTLNKWRADYVWNTEKEIKIQKNGKNIKTNWDWAETAKYVQLQDRIKWGVNVTSDITGTIKEKFILTSDCEVTIIPNSEFAGHYVSCGMWGDYQDLVDEGYDVKITKEDWNQLEIEIEKDSLTPNSVYYLDPATGGLNTGWFNRSFSVIPNTEMSVTWTMQLLNTAGFGTLHYNNVSDSSHIAGALCNYTIIDTGLHVHTQNFTDEGTFYFGNYTPDHIGEHQATIQCAKTNWTTQILSVNFTVFAGGTSTSINLNVDSGDEVTRTYCVANDKYVELNKTVCVELQCNDVSTTYSVTCPNGCGDGQCLPSQIELGLWFLVIIFFAVILLLAMGLT